MDQKLVKATALVGMAISVSGCGPLACLIGHNAVRGSGVVAQENRNVGSDFTKIQDDGAADVIVRVGPARSVKVEGDDNIVPLVQTTIKDGTLIIKTKRSIKPKKKLLVTVTLPTIEQVALDGAGNVTVTDVASPNLSVSLDGAGNMTVSGRAETLDASLDGAGNLRLDELQAKSASASIDGAGNIDLWVTGSLKAQVDGVGRIRYKGLPTVEKHVDGVGRIGPLL